jgi:hypothetical protein
MPDLIDDLRRYGEALEPEVTHRLRPPDAYPVAHSQSVVPRRHRAVLLAAAATLLVVAGLLALIGPRPATDESVMVDDPPSTSATPGPPWIGPADPTQVNAFDFWELDGSLHWMTALEGGQWLVDVSVGRADLHEVPGSWADTVVGGRPALLGTANLGEALAPTLRIDLGEGWLLVVAGSVTSGPAEDHLPRVVDLAEQLAPRGPSFWTQVIDRSQRDQRTETAAGYKLGLDEPHGRTYVRTLMATTVTSALVVPNHPTETFELLSMLRIGGTPSSLPNGEPVTVRGMAGVVGSDTDMEGRPRQVIAWFEDDYQHRLSTSPDVDVEIALRLAANLEVLPEPSWQRALFPATVPTSLLEQDS